MDDHDFQRSWLHAHDGVPLNRHLPVYVRIVGGPDAGSLRKVDKVTIEAETNDLDRIVIVVEPW